MIRITELPVELLKIVFTYLQDKSSEKQQCPAIQRFIQTEVGLYNQFKSQRQLVLHCSDKRDCSAVRKALHFKIVKPYEQLRIQVFNDVEPFLLNELKNDPSTSLEFNELLFAKRILKESVSIIAETSKLSSLVIQLSCQHSCYVRDHNLLKKLEEVLREKALLPSFGLKNLNITYYHEPSITLPYFVDLEDLKFFNPTSILTSKTLDSYQSIQKLTISCYNHPLDVSLLSNVHDLVLHKCTVITDVSALRNNYSITIRDCWKVSNYGDRFGMNSSKICIAGGIRNFKINIAQFNKVNELTICCRDDLPFRPTFFSQENQNIIITDEIPHTLQYCYLVDIRPTQPANLANIQHLCLHNINYLTNLNGLGSSRQINVEIYGCDNIIDFSALKYVPHVIITSCKGFKDCMQLEGVKHLEISSCDNIIDFSALKFVPHVIINNCKGFKDCMQLEGVKHLEIWNCSHVVNIGESAVLEHLELIKCKKCSFSLNQRNLGIFRFDCCFKNAIDYILRNNHMKIIFAAYDRWEFTKQQNYENFLNTLQDRYIPVDKHGYSAQSARCTSNYIYLLKEN